MDPNSVHTGLSIVTLIAAAAGFIVNLTVKAELTSMKLDLIERINLEAKESAKKFAGIDIEQRVYLLETQNRRQNAN